MERGERGLKEGERGGEGERGRGREGERKERERERGGEGERGRGGEGERGR